MRCPVVVAAAIAAVTLAATAVVPGFRSSANAAGKLKVGFIYLGPVSDYG